MSNRVSALWRGNLSLSIELTIGLCVHLISTDTGDSLLEFWKSKTSQWPRLVKVAQMVLAISATETSSERVFSITGRTMEDRRSQLNVETVDDLMFVHGLHK